MAKADRWDLQQEWERFYNALMVIADFRDDAANEHLNLTGSYELFNEPKSVQIARKALKMPWVFSREKNEMED